MTKGLERIFEMTSARDCHDGCAFGSARCKPGSGGYHGRHGAEMRMVVKGEHGAIQFVVYTNWHAKPTYDHLVAAHDPANAFGYGPGWSARLVFGPMAADLGYHKRTEEWEGQLRTDDCPYLDGDPCYYDGSGLWAEEVFETLVTKGSDAVWNRLEAEYATRCVPETAPRSES